LGKIVCFARTTVHEDNTKGKEMHRWLVRNVMFPLHERLLGHPTSELLRDMEAADRMTEAELKELSSARLRGLIQYSFDHVPYMRARMEETGVRPEQIESPEDLIRLPVVRKSDIRAHRAQLRSTVSKSWSSIPPLVPTGILCCSISRSEESLRVSLAGSE